MSAPRSPETLALAARLYYLDGLSQQQIATHMSMTRSNVSRALRAAREQGIVRIRIEEPLARHERLEQALVTTFGLDEALVVSAEHAEHAVDRTGRLAARWLVNHLRDDMSVGLSWGRTLQAMVAHVEVDGVHDVEVLQLGGDLQLDPRLSGHELIRDLAARLGGRYAYLHAPALLDSAETVRRLLANPAIGDQLERARDVDVAVVGIGAAGHGFAARLLDSAHLTAHERAAFNEAGPVGDICARFYDADGTPVRTPLTDRVLALDFDDLAAIPSVVGVAAGSEKGAALWGAMRGGLVDVVVTDQAAAAAALHLERAAHDPPTIAEPSSDLRPQPVAS